MESYSKIKGSKFEKPINELQLDLNRHKMIIYLLEGKRKKSYIIFAKNKKNKLLDILLVVFSLMPFSLTILKVLYLRKLKNGL